MFAYLMYFFFGTGPVADTKRRFEEKAAAAWTEYKANEPDLKRFAPIETSSLRGRLAYSTKWSVFASSDTIDALLLELRKLVAGVKILLLPWIPYLEAIGGDPREQWRLLGRVGTVSRDRQITLAVAQDLFTKLSSERDEQVDVNRQKEREAKREATRQWQSECVVRIDEQRCTNPQGYLLLTLLEEEIAKTNGEATSGGISYPVIQQSSPGRWPLGSDSREVERHLNAVLAAVHSHYAKFAHVLCRFPEHSHHILVADFQKELAKCSPLLPNRVLAFEEVAESCCRAIENISLKARLKLARRRINDGASPASPFTEEMLDYCESKYLGKLLPVGYRRGVVAAIEAFVDRQQPPPPSRPGTKQVEPVNDDANRRKTEELEFEHVLSEFANEARRGGADDAQIEQAMRQMRADFERSRT